MNCNQIRELLPEVITSAGMDASMSEVEKEVQKHIASCDACAAHLAALQKTMALLDEWQAPEPSPYFDTRLEARLSEARRAEMARRAAGWLSWTRRPAWAMSLAAVVFAGALLVSNKSLLLTATIPTKPPSLGLPVEPGTAVGDLQALERNDELYADFDMLDELQVQDDVTANP
ncbi:MAG: anti-sigma factor family protein [Terriglobales bacterium]